MRLFLLFNQSNRIENGWNGLNGFERILTCLRLVLIRRRWKKIRFDPFHPFDPFYNHAALAAIVLYPLAQVFLINRQTQCLF